MPEIRAGLVLLVSLVARTSSATSPDPPITILAVGRSEAPIPDGIDLVLEFDSVLDVGVTGVLVASDLNESSSATTAISLIDPKDIDAADVNLVLAAGFAVAGRGDVVKVPWPHLMSLAPGVYLERLHVSIRLSDSDVPWELTGSLSFEVNDTGVQPLSTEDYFSVADPPTALEDGTTVYQVVDIATVMARRSR